MRYNVFIGYDQREDVAAHVCKYSIERRTSPEDEVHTRFLKTEDIPGYGRVVVEPQSTDFTFSRFWVPHLSDYKGFSVFCDCDFLFLDDIGELIRSVDPYAAVSVVKHPRYVPNSDTKMDNIPQHQSPRKNWASLMVFNNEHPRCKYLSPKYLTNVVPGKKLHDFAWVADENIGSLSFDWNVLDGYYQLDNPRAIHYTDGGPWFSNHQDTYYSQHWIEEYNDYRESFRQRTN
jgi:hypothetical protein